MTPGSRHPRPARSTSSAACNRAAPYALDRCPRSAAAALLGYPSALALLAVEARDGRLRIAPKRVLSTSEPLLPEVRRSVEEAFAAPVANVYGTSEAGPIGVGCWRGPGLHLCDDLAIVEYQVRQTRPVPRPW